MASPRYVARQRKMKEPGSRHARYVFTVNNYTEEDLKQIEDVFKSEAVRYAIAGKEVALTGTPHVQAYVAFKSGRGKGFTTMKKLIENAHYDLAEGTDKDQDYCWKDDQWLKVGEAKEPEQGKRTDLQIIRQCVDEGKTITDMMDGGVVKNLQGLSLAEKLGRYGKKKRNWQPTVVWLWGVPGSGKTETVYRLCERLGVSLYSRPDDLGKFWDGYDSHEAVLLDEIRAYDWKLSSLLKLLGSRPYLANIKYGAGQILAHYFFITSPFHWKTIFEGENENLGQLDRRISHTWEYKNKLEDCDEIGDVDQQLKDLAEAAEYLLKMGGNIWDL